MASIAIVGGSGHPGNAIALARAGHDLAIGSRSADSAGAAADGAGIRSTGLTQAPPIA